MTPLDCPHREPFRITLVRTGTIAVIVGAIIARAWGGLERWPLATLVALWPALGGHYVELFFLNHLRPRLARTPVVRMAVRVAVWFLAGMVLALAMNLTATALNPVHPGRRLAWYVGGVAFIGIELIAHLFLQVRRRPSFYNGRG